MGNVTEQRHALCGYEIIDERDAKVPLTVREVFFNFSVYESIKVIAGVPVFIDDHIERLFESAHRLAMVHGFSPQPLIEAIGSLIAEDSIENSSLRVQLVGGEQPYLYVFAQSLPIYPDRYYEQGMKVISYAGERIEPEVKSNALLLNYLALRSAHEAGAFEAVLIDRNGMAMEGTRSNVFGIRSHTLFTPGTGVLSGVTRKYLLQAAQELGMGITYAHTSLADVAEGFFDEYFLSSTSMGALPVSHMDGKVIGTSFPLTGQLHAAVRRVEHEYISSVSS